MTRTKFILFAITLTFILTGKSLSQSKIAPAAAVPPAKPAAVAPPAAAIVATFEEQETPQAAEAPQKPRVWSLAIDDGNYLGVETEQITNENLKTYGLREAQGVGISEVVKGSPADQAGLQKGDVILRIDSESITSVRKLERLIDEAEPNHSMRLTISRHGAEQELTVKLGKRPGALGNFSVSLGRDFGDTLVAPMPGRNFEFNAPGGGFAYVFGSSRRIGVGTTHLTKQLADYFGVKDGGILITSVDENGPAAKAGIKAGDCITAIDGNRVDSLQGLVRELSRKKDGAVKVTITRDRNSRTIDVTPETGGFPGGLELNDIPQIGALTVPLVSTPFIEGIDTFITPRSLIDFPPLAPKPGVLIVPSTPPQQLVP